MFESIFVVFVVLPVVFMVIGALCWKLPGSNDVSGTPTVHIEHEPQHYPTQPMPPRGHQPLTGKDLPGGWLMPDTLEAAFESILPGGE